MGASRLFVTIAQGLNTVTAREPVSAVSVKMQNDRWTSKYTRRAVRLHTNPAITSSPILMNRTSQVAYPSVHCSARHTDSMQDTADPPLQLHDNDQSSGAPKITNGEDEQPSQRAEPPVTSEEHEDVFTSAHRLCESLNKLEQYQHGGTEWQQMVADSGCSGRSYNYAEAGLNFFALFFDRCLHLCPRLHGDSGGRFYDIGSGFGKLVIAAAWLRRWDRCAGLEIVEAMHEQAVELLGQARSGALQVAPELDNSTLLEPVHFVLGDLTQEDWSDADMVLCNSLVFEPPLMAAFTTQAEKLHQGQLYSHPKG